MRPALSLIVLVLTLGCAGGGSPPPSTGAPAVAVAAPTAPAAPPIPGAPAAVNPASVNPAVWTPPAVPRCDTEALLVAYSFADLQRGGYCRVCKDMDVHACELDWPTSDVPDCGLWDEMRNGIYAYYGRPFESEKWARHFAQRSWYHPDPTYTDARLSAVAVANVALLKDMRAKKTACQEY